MFEKSFPGGVWPVMITPYTMEGKIDFDALQALVDWYITAGANGLFAVCQSSEMFYLTIEERCAIAHAVVEYANGRVPVICSGHVSDTANAQADELRAMATTGVDALILLTNRFAAEQESDEIWFARCMALLNELDPVMPLGFYECPYPYKRVLSPALLKACADTGKFYFLKDTCCNAGLIREKIDAVRGSKLAVYNANTTTLLDSLRYGAAGYSGVMANFHPELYVWLCDQVDNLRANRLSDWLSIASLIERQLYPVNAKYHLQALRGIPMTTCSRACDYTKLTEVFREEVRALDRLALFEAETIGCKLHRYAGMEQV